MVKKTEELKKSKTSKTAATSKVDVDIRDSKTKKIVADKKVSKRANKSDKAPSDVSVSNQSKGAVKKSGAARGGKKSNKKVAEKIKEQLQHKSQENVQTPKTLDTYAIVKKGSAQYLLEQGALLEIPRINVPEGKEYKFEEVLLASIKNELKIGAPIIKGAYVKVFVVKQVKGTKQRGFKYKAKSRYRKTWGYRNPKTRIRVIEIKA